MAPKKQKPKQRANTQPIEGAAYVYSAHPLAEVVRGATTHDLPNRYLNEQDPLLPLCRWEHWDFQRTHNPFSALRTFRNFHERRLYPPIEVLDCLAKGIRQFLKADGTARLDDCLGLVGKPGRGHNYLARTQRRGRDLNLCYTMFILKKNFSLSLRKCAELVSLLPHTVSEERLLFIYETDPAWKTWRATLTQEGDRSVIQTKEGKMHFVAPFPYDDDRVPTNVKKYHPASFPYDDLPPDLRKYHPDHPKRHA